MTIKYQIMTLNILSFMHFNIQDGINKAFHEIMYNSNFLYLKKHIHIDSFKNFNLFLKLIP